MSSTPLAAVEVVLPILVPFLFIAFLGFIIWAAVVQTRKGRENLTTLADRLGLALQEPVRRGPFSSGSRQLTGAFRNRPVRVYTFTTGSGKSRSSWCALSMQVRTAPGFSFKITGENLFTKAGRIFGVEDVQTGDAAFDEKFYLKSKQPEYIRAALIPEIRTRLLDALRRHRQIGSFTIENGEVKYTEMGNFANRSVCDRFPTMIEIATDLAEIAEAWR